MRFLELARSYRVASGEMRFLELALSYRVASGEMRFLELALSYRVASGEMCFLELALSYRVASEVRFLELAFLSLICIILTEFYARRISGTKTDYS